DLVVEIGTDERAVRPRELQAHDGRQPAREREEAECGDEHARGDGFVADRGEEADDAPRRRPRLRELALVPDLVDHLRPPRYASSACSSSDVSAIVGMFTPGFTRCGSTIHPARWPVVFGMIPAASVAR